MRWIFLLLFVIAEADAQFVFGNNHPAAAPDVAGELAGKVLDLGLNEDLQVKQEGLIGPEGRAFVVPLRSKSQKAEEELRRESEEIERILANKTSIVVVEEKHAVTWRTVFYTMLGCALVVSCGILPAFFLPVNSNEYLQTEEGKQKLSYLLAFSVGTLLGDVFLHLLPETWNSFNVSQETIGMYTISGLLFCFMIEKICATTEEMQHQVCAMLNLAANLIDNFTHGLAVGASFLISPQSGFITTAAILLHEIPHEVSDFAILLRADFDRMKAVKAQFVTAMGGVLGAVVALWLRASSTEDMALWILPFTAGGFINIALIQILPELNKESGSRNNLTQLGLIVAGIATMSIVNTFH